jgi:hypothetical protein
MRLAPQQHHEAGNIQQGWHHNNISTKLEIFSTNLASSARGWHHNNISTKLEIFSMRMASCIEKLEIFSTKQQHQHEVGNL